MKTLSLLCVFAAAASAMPHPFPQPGPLALALAQGGLDSSSFLPAAPLQQGQPLRRQVDVAQPRDYHKPSYKHEVGRVKIQVYRGPNKNKCGYNDKYCQEFAPWGYYNTQPQDAKKKKGYHH